MAKKINKKKKTISKPSKKGTWVEPHDQMNHGKKVHVIGYYTSRKNK